MAVMMVVMRAVEDCSHEATGYPKRAARCKGRDRRPFDGSRVPRDGRPFGVRVALAGRQGRRAIMTSVALMTATASWPRFSLSASTPSRVMTAVSC